ncbi:MAG: glycosyltransferase family 1 protein [Candidatus Magasanikbacteria bacterium]
MRIGIDASRANKKQKTGVEWYAFFLIEHLKKLKTGPVQFGKYKGEPVEFILYSETELKGSLAKLPEGWSSKVLHWPPKRFWTQIRLSLEMLFYKPDVLFIPAHVVPLIHPKRTVMTIHDVAATRFPKTYNLFERWYSLWSSRYALKHLWRIIVPSEFTKKELRALVKLGEVRPHIHVVHHGYDKRYFQIENKEEIEECLVRYGLKRPFFMSIGRLEIKKNTTRIIQAFSHVRESFVPQGFQLLLVGKPGYGYEHVEKVLEGSSYREDIVIPGWVDDRDLPYLVNAADIFIFPSLYEGFGLPLLEAFACGTPVVASRGNSLEEVGSNAAVFVDPEDEKEIAEAVKLLLTHSELRAQRIQRGVARASEFSWKKSAEKTMDILLGFS